MKRFSEQLIHRCGQSASLILALGLLGGAVVGTAYPASADIFQGDGLAPSSGSSTPSSESSTPSSGSDTSYYDSLYSGSSDSSEEGTEGTYGAEGVPEPATLTGLALAGFGFAYLRRRQQNKA